MLAIELKYGPSFTATGICTSAFTALHQVDVLLLDLRRRCGPGSVGM